MIGEVAAIAAVATTFAGTVTLPFWFGSIAPHVLRHCGGVHPAADLCIRLLDLNLGWTSKDKYSDLRHETGVFVKMSWDNAAERMAVNSVPIPLNRASRAALTVAARRWKRAQARHTSVQAEVGADRATADFARRVTAMYDPDKVVPIKQGRRA